jgi:hypothetical protein
MKNVSNTLPAGMLSRGKGNALLMEQIRDKDQSTSP